MHDHVEYVRFRVHQEPKETLLNGSCMDSRGVAQDLQIIARLSRCRPVVASRDASFPFLDDHDGTSFATSMRAASFVDHLSKRVVDCFRADHHLLKIIYLLMCYNSCLSLIS